LIGGDCSKFKIFFSSVGGAAAALIFLSAGRLESFNFFSPVGGIYFLSAARLLYLFLIGGGGSADRLTPVAITIRLFGLPLSRPLVYDFSK
jgi:hypothetical protein